ncbi:50S ribosomal protein L5 [Patescibacteria group bacterium]|nr:50S ribosomal protein L5 [Patescibacteria group bacterium]
MHPFLTTYNQKAIPALTKAKQYPSTFLIPKVEKVVVNVGVGDCLGNDKALQEVILLMSQITGQKPVENKARQAISGFKIRQGMIVGLKTTLRGEKMRDFLSKLTLVALPRTRDFRGLPPSSVTADGNLNIGIKDSMIFPEASQLGSSHGLQVTVVSTAASREEARLLYECLGFVFQNEADIQRKPAKKRTYYSKK